MQRFSTQSNLRPSFLNFSGDTTELSYSRLPWGHSQGRWTLWSSTSLSLCPRFFRGSGSRWPETQATGPALFNCHPQTKRTSSLHRLLDEMGAPWVKPEDLYCPRKAKSSQGGWGWRETSVLVYCWWDWETAISHFKTQTLWPSDPTSHCLLSPPRLGISRESLATGYETWVWR